jgi:rhodanese-related sulfurtransferase
LIVLEEFMRLVVSVGAALLLAVIALTACNSHEQTPKISSASPATSPAQLPPADNVRRITPAELRDELRRNDVVIIDVRGEAAYKQGHIKGARLIPATDILAHVDELPRDKMIVTYCSWPAEHTSASSVVNLKTKGINNAAAVLGGYDAMIKVGFEVVTGMDPNVSK